METEKKIKYLMEELKGYIEYMECYEEYSESGHTELANVFYTMAQNEHSHAQMLTKAYPELEKIVEILKTF